MKKYLYSLIAIVIIGVSILTYSQFAKADIYGSSLVGWWTLDNTRYSTGAGGVIDSSGNGNNGTQSGTPTANAVGKVQQALSFDGVDDYVNMGDVLDMGTGDFTVCLWAKPGNLGASNREINLISKLLNWNDANSWAFELDTYGSGSATSYNVDAYIGGMNVLTNTRFPVDVWHHFCFTRVGTTFSIYSDGVADGSGTDAAFDNDVSNAQSLQLAKKQNWQQIEYPGSLDDVRIYDRALSAGEVQQLYLQGASLHFNDDF